MWHRVYAWPEVGVVVMGPEGPVPVCGGEGGGGSSHPAT